MTLTDIHSKLSTLGDLSERSASLVPEMSSTLSLLVKDLTSLVRLDLPRDRRLLTVDLDNLIEGLGRIIKIRAEGLDPKELEMAVVDMTALAADMRARAAKAIHNEAGEIAIHASVATMRIDKMAEPQDLTREFRMITAVPQPPKSNAPGLIVDTPSIGSAHAFGRITGNVLTAVVAKNLSAAALGSSVLPPNTMAKFERGDVITVFTEGVNTQGQFDPPHRNPHCSALLIEGGHGGFVVHGPAVIKVTECPKEELHIFHEYKRFADTARKTLAQKVGRAHRKIATPVLTVGLFIISSFSVYIHGPSSGAESFHSMFLWSLLMSLPFFVLVGVLMHAIEKHQNKRAFASASEVLRSPKVFQAAMDFLTRHGMSAGHIDHIYKGQDPGIPSGMPDIHLRKQLNILPAGKIQTLSSGEVNVMRPLPALPPPSPINSHIDMDASEKLPA